MFHLMTPHAALGMQKILMTTLTIAAFLTDLGTAAAKVMDPVDKLPIQEPFLIRSALPNTNRMPMSLSTPHSLVPIDFFPALLSAGRAKEGTRTGWLEVFFAPLAWLSIVVFSHIVSLSSGLSVTRFSLNSQS